VATKGPASKLSDPDEAIVERAALGAKVDDLGDQRLVQGNDYNSNG